MAFFSLAAGVGAGKKRPRGGRPRRGPHGYPSPGRTAGKGGFRWPKGVERKWTGSKRQKTTGAWRTGVLS